MRARKTDDDDIDPDALDRDLARRIMIWAETWKRCPRKGCRRVRACRDFDDCAGVGNEPVSFTPEAQRAIRSALDEALGLARPDEPPPPQYDPDERARNRPLPPPPERC